MLHQHTRRLGARRRPDGAGAAPRLLNLGVVAHIDAGKTSLTERLLFDTGATASLGRVDAGTTRTDSMSIERRRGITIRAAVTAVRIGEVDVSVIDTPGHSDFVAEVERSLGVLDAVILVLSAVEGVQPQTVTLWRSLRRIGIPTLLFLNKIDRGSADPERVLTDVRQRLTQDVVPLTGVRLPGCAAAEIGRRAWHDPRVLEPVVGTDDRLLQRWVDGRPVEDLELEDALRRATDRGRLFPVLSGSAVTGAGIDHLRWAVEHLLASPPGVAGAPAATVFAVDRTAATRRTWLRLWAGEITVRDRLGTGERTDRITSITVETPGGTEHREAACSGELAAVTGLTGLRIGDVLGAPPPARGAARLTGATFEADVQPVDPGDRIRVMQALRVLADEDPLLDLHVDGESVRVRTHGEVQREVIAALLEERFGVAARFSHSTVACIERLSGDGHAVETLGVNGNPYLATVGLTLTRLPDSGDVVFSPGVQRGLLPQSFVAATEEGVRDALRQGPHGWPVLGVAVTMTASRYFPRQSHAHQRFDKAMSSVTADFRHLAPVVLAECLRQAGTHVCEPLERFDLDVPAVHLGAALQLLTRCDGVVDLTDGTGRYRHLGGTLPTARLGTVLQALPDLTGGEGALTSRFDSHRAVRVDRDWARTRTGPDPSDREGWFRARPR
ncbi:TetM/TetW/TetO/TetS family tetracycline resistance ribosomal protection protein [Amnibacterium sp. CER49]|uniref:TetM/TetW/TetO/TetS family tetracycline resistance ribosomal protection protein n=1 Tax=Amnibacterium sp. CER49 TaxID=3039161 RepID=UPI00244705FD|nr:TetM/TetW/TetO/TetS family tetracycline resistance ribosomal protection protein [Amnibacterium sp. CER49]MDH2444844.1 TetM/TetW/TetO/TetS family tetracycline resistance ribosomal protection protein [Amnibacterium sp. CER49]